MVRTSATGLVLLLAVGVVGCGSRDTDPRSKSSKSPNEEIADYLARETKMGSDQADALVATSDDAIQPREVPDGWEHVDAGMWMRNYKGKSAVVTIGSYPVGNAVDMSPERLLRVTKQGLEHFSEVPPTFHRESIGTYLQRAESAKLDYASVTPAGNEVEHVQYILRIGARVYNVVGGAQTSIWPELRPEIERFIASFDFEHPVPEAALIPPGIASDGDVQKLFAGASAREVQDAIATWTYSPEGESKPWFPVRAECDVPTSAVPTDWTCEVDFLTPKGREDGVELDIHARANGKWDVELDA